jgi:acyl-CoA synthetase (AMP-forming)/AMP-acid ligase II
VVFVEGTDASTLTTALRDHRIERFNAIPALWLRLADHVQGLPADESTFPDLRFADTGTSPTSVELLATIVGLAPNAHVRVFYGSSEAGNVASLHHDDLLTRPGSCGQPSVLTTVAIADDGELLVSGPLLFDGYLGDPAATETALRDGWYHTGDRAELDAQGYLSIVGRVGTVIRTGGESVEPDVVQRVLARHPSIDDVVVFGVPDERWGEVVCAAIVATGALTIADLRRYLRDDVHPVPAHQHPRRLLVLDDLPRTAATGQIDRHRLRQQVLAQPSATGSADTGPLADHHDQDPA